MAKSLKKTVRKTVSRISDQIADTVSENPKAVAAGAVGVVAATVGLIAARKIGSNNKDSGDFHILSKDGGWVLREANSDQVLDSFERKRDAIKAGRKHAKEFRPSRLIVHDAAGRVGRTHTYRPETSGD